MHCNPSRAARSISKCTGQGWHRAGGTALLSWLLLDLQTGHCRTCPGGSWRPRASRGRRVQAPRTRPLHASIMQGTAERNHSSHLSNECARKTKSSWETPGYRNQTFPNDNALLLTSAQDCPPLRRSPSAKPSAQSPQHMYCEMPSSERWTVSRRVLQAESAERLRPCSTEIP